MLSRVIRILILVAILSVGFGFIFFEPLIPIDFKDFYQVMSQPDNLVSGGIHPKTLMPYGHLLLLGIIAFMIWDSYRWPWSLLGIFIQSIVRLRRNDRRWRRAFFYLGLMSMFYDIIYYTVEFIEIIELEFSDMLTGYAWVVVIGVTLDIWLLYRIQNLFLLAQTQERKE